MASEGIVDADLISQLPEPILHQILSFAPLKYAARTSILSKRWNSIWNTLPYLNFGNDFFIDPFCYIPEKDHLDRTNMKIRKKNKYLLKVADKIILSRCKQQMADIQKLCLWIHEHEISRERRQLEYTSSSHLKLKLERWMLVVAKSSLRVLDLQIHYDKYDYHDLPSTIVLAKSINVLSLCGFNLMSMSSVDIKFSSLRKLLLSDVYLEDPIMTKLISGCPLLWSFRLHGCQGLKTIFTTGLRKLKLLELHNIPELKLLRIEDALDLLDLTGLSELCRVNLATSASLRELNLCGPFITENYLHQLVSECVFLEFLTIGGSEALENIKISTDKIKRLYLHGLHKLVKAEINAPNLERFRFTSDQISFPTFSLSAPNMLEVGLRLTIFGLVKDLSHNQLIKFLEYFNHFRIVNLLGRSDNVIVPKEKRDIFLSPLCGTRHLNLYFSFDMKSSVVELVEYMLWLSPRAESFLLTYRRKRKLVLKFLYEKNVCGPCCEFLSGQCWRHSLTEVRIEKFEGEEEDRTNLKNFFHQLGKNLKIVENPKIIEKFCESHSFYDGLYSSYDELFSNEF